MENASSHQESTPKTSKTSKKSPEEEIVSNLNRIRFKSRDFSQEIVKKVKENADFEQKTVNLPNISKQIRYYDEEILLNFFTYLQRTEQTCEILQDFSFSRTIHEKFLNNFAEVLQKHGKLSLESQKTAETLRKELMGEGFCGYFIENIRLDDMNSLFLLIILEEFVSLSLKSQKIPIDFPQNVLIECEESLKIDTISFLSNNFNSICVFLQETQQKTDKIAYNLYILLFSSDYFEREDSKTKETQENSKKMAEKPSESGNLLHIQRKYEKIFIPNMQIPKSSINKLVLALDSDNDYKVSLQDIENFARKHYIHFEKQVISIKTLINTPIKFKFFQEMFLEAASKRTKLRIPANLMNMSPLTFAEIQQAMRITLRKQGNQWVEHYRPFRDIWLLFLNRLGESQILRKSQPALKIQPIPDLLVNSQYSFEKTRSAENYSKIIEKKPAVFQSKYSPEANVIVNNTRYIKEIVYDRNNPEDFEPNPFEKVVNKEFHSVENNSSIGFDTKMYYEEALKLSRTPEKYKKIEQNPILTYVPEKFASEKCMILSIFC